MSSQSAPTCSHPGAMDVTKSYKFMGLGAVYVTKPYKFTGFGAMDVTKPYKFIKFGAHIFYFVCSGTSFRGPRGRIRAPERGC